MTNFWEEVGSWSNDMKGLVICLGMFATTICFITLMVAAVNANDNRLMEKCLQTYTPRACAVLEMSAVQLEELEDE